MIRMKKFLLLALFGLGSDAFLIRRKIQHAVHKAEPQPAVYNTAEELAQQYTEYSALVHAALTEDKTFSTFKSQPCYMKILEHVTEEQGVQIKQLCRREKKTCRRENKVECDIRPRLDLLSKFNRILTPP